MKEDIEQKLSKIFIPFVLIFIGILVAYTYANYFIFIELQLFSIKTLIINFVVPALLTGAIVWLYLRKKIRILNLKNKKGKELLNLYCWVAWLFMCVPVVITQSYLASSTGKLTEIQSIKEITKLPPTKYYKIDKYYVYKEKAHTYFHFHNIPKRYGIDDLGLTIFVAIPVLENVNDTTMFIAQSWLGVKYSDHITQSASIERKEEFVRKFSEECQLKLDRTDFSHFTYFEKMENTYDRDNYQKAIGVPYEKAYPANKILLTGEKEPFEMRNGHKTDWILGFVLGGILIFGVMIFFPKLDTEKALKKEIEAEKRSIKDTKEFLLPHKYFFVTPILLYINLLLFLLMVFAGLGFISFQGQDLLKWGANHGYFVKNGEYWRLLTSVFLHGGLFHIMYNMFALVFLGIFIEGKIGSWKYLILYLLTGISASIASTWWHNPPAVSVGASGAIFGLLGAFIALMLVKKYDKSFNKFFLIGTLIYAGINLLIGLTGGIDNAAHIGGLLSGFVLGLIISPFVKSDYKKKRKSKNRIAAKSHSE
jgi:membrane associated rhomboid family serine protease